MKKNTEFDKTLKNERLKTALAIMWENVWPPILPSLNIIAIFLIISWAGLWPILPNTIRILIIITLFVAFTISLKNWLSIKLPTAKNINKRLQKTSQLNHQPLEALKDKIANANTTANILWREHKKRTLAKIKNLKTEIAKPLVAKTDPYAIRHAIILLFAITFIMAGDNRIKNIKDGFRHHTSIATHENATRINAWIKPPLYTKQPPIFLQTTQNKIIKIPQNSELIFQTSGFEKPQLFIENQHTKNSIDLETKDGLHEFKTKLTQSAKIIFQQNENTTQNITWQYEIIADKKPTIKFTKDPEINNQGWLELHYEMNDDYGFKNAFATIKLKNIKPQQKPLLSEIKLPLNINHNDKKATGKTSQNYLEHVFAGKQVEITLDITDFAEQKNYSPTKTIKLPQKLFVEPLAKAIMYERQNIALDINKQYESLNQLDAITTTRPDIFIPDISNYLTLRVARHKINNNEFKSAVDMLLHSALIIENGDLSLAAQKLRQAQNKLAQALAQNADDDTLQRLMEELRQAMQDFMQQMQQYTQQQKEQNFNQDFSQNFNEQTQTLTQNDIEKMMQQIEDLARSGSRDAARELLQQFQQMMSNLQFNRQNQNPQTDPFSKNINELGKMLQQQQQLMDKTHELQDNIDNKEKLENALKKLQQQQKQLKEKMKNLQQEFENLGLGENNPLANAQEFMGQAEDNLGTGKGNEAMKQQGNALQAMRDAAQEFMQQMKDQANGQSSGLERGQHSRGGRDPLGRPTGKSSGWQNGDETKIPNEINTQKAREVLDKIRKKLGEIKRPKAELDYLQRLLPTQ